MMVLTQGKQASHTVHSCDQLYMHAAVIAAFAGPFEVCTVANKPVKSTCTEIA